MKRLSVLFILSVIFILGCAKLKDESNSAKSLLSRLLLRRSGSNSSVINAALPASLAVSVPRSIRKTSSSGSVSVRSLLLGEDVSEGYGIKATPTPDPATEIAEGRSGNAYLAEQTDLISQILKESKMDLILISGVYDIAKASPGVCIPGGTSSISITQDMVNEIIAGLEEQGLSNEEAKAQLTAIQDSGGLPSIGDSLPSPAIVYRRLTGNDDYDVQLDYSLNPNITTAQPCPRNNKYLKTLKFNDALTNIYASISISISVFGTLLEISSDVTKISKPNTKDRSILNTTQVITPKRGSKNKQTSTFSVEECNADDAANAAKNCITMKLNVVGDAAGKKVTVRVVGRTDDDGGYVKTEVDDKIVSPSKSYDLEETYDKDGNITYMKATGQGNAAKFFGTFDSAEYGEYFQTSYAFDGEIFVTTDFVSIGTDSGYEFYDEFVIVADGNTDPNVSPDQIIGYGVYFDYSNNGNFDAGSINAPTDEEVFISYFGTAADVPNAWLWRAVYDANFNFLYYEQTFDTLSQI
jgi:hypothetical protein